MTGWEEISGGERGGGKSSLSSDSFVPLVLKVQHLARTWPVTKRITVTHTSEDQHSEDDTADGHMEDVHRLYREFILKLTDIYVPLP